MAKLSAVLKNVGKDLGDVGKWIDIGVKAAGPVVEALDPPLVPIVNEIETLLGNLPTTATTGTAGSTTTAPAISAATLQAIVQAIATLESIKAAAPATPSSAPQ
jgi:hypothetical protein